MSQKIALPIGRTAASRFFSTLRKSLTGHTPLYDEKKE
jgi:hypothetical protein